MDFTARRVVLSEMVTYYNWILCGDCYANASFGVHADKDWLIILKKNSDQMTHLGLSLHTVAAPTLIQRRDHSRVATVGRRWWDLTAYVEVVQYLHTCTHTHTHLVNTCTWHVHTHIQTYILWKVFRRLVFYISIWPEIGDFGRTFVNFWPDFVLCPAVIISSAHTYTMTSIIQTLRILVAWDFGRLVSWSMCSTL